MVLDQAVCTVDFSLQVVSSVARLVTTLANVSALLDVSS